METTPASDSDDVRGYLRPLWSRRWLILAIVAVTTASTYVYYAGRPKAYTATTKVFVQTSEVDQALFGSDSAVDPDRNTVNQATLLRSRSVAREVARRIGFRGDPAALLADVKVQTQPGADFVSIQATQPTARGAARLANTFTDSFISLRRASARRRISAAREIAIEQLAGVGTGPGSLEARRALQSRIKRLEVLEALPTGGAEQVDPALAPRLPSAPKPKRNAAFALFMSLVLALALAYGLERMDRRIKRADDIEELYGLPMLATIPHAKRMSPTVDGQSVLPPPLVEPFRSLRTNLQLANPDTPLRTIVITSAVPEEGKSSVVRNLALAYRELGLRVAVIEGDLRQPVLAEVFGVAPMPGLTNVLAGQSSLGDALQPVAVGAPALAEGTKLRRGKVATNGRLNGADGAIGSGDLVVLTSGPRPANPPAIFSADRLRDLLARLADQYDIVLIDSPPMLVVSDIVPLLSAVDGVIIVARVGKTTREAARRVTELARRAPGARLVGVVANDVQRAESRSHYGYLDA